MENEESKNKTTEKENQSDSDQTDESTSVETLKLELEELKFSLQKRKSETTTLKILFYTGLAVLLFGFIYTSQTLQRAQNQNLESNIAFMQSQVNHTLLLLERKLHNEIQDLDAKVSGTSGINFHETIQSMNEALDQLEPKTTTSSILIDKVKKDSIELSQMVGTLPTQEEMFLIPVP